MSISVVPLGTEKMSTAIRGPTESWSGPGLHLSSYPTCSHSTRGHDDASFLINNTLSFPHRAWCHLQRYPYRRRGEYPDISRTTGSCEDDLAYLSKLMWPLIPETLSSSLRCLVWSGALLPGSFTSLILCWDLLP